MIKINVIILCGGDGTRLGKLGEKKPKALVKIGEKTILDHQIDFLRRYPYIDTIFLAAGYKSEMIEKHLLKKKIEGIVVVKEKKKLGTAGAIRNVLKKHKVSEEFIAFNVDDLVDLDLNRFIKKNPTIAVAHPLAEFGIVKLQYSGNASGRWIPLKGFKEKGPLSCYVSIGWYFLNTKITFPEIGMLETDVFPGLAEKGDLTAFRHQGRWKPVNTQKDIEELEKK